MLGRPGPGQDPGLSSPLSAPPTARPAPGEHSRESGNPTPTTSGPLLLCHHRTPDLPLQASPWCHPFKDCGDPSSILQASESKPCSSPVNQSPLLQEPSPGAATLSAPRPQSCHAGQPLRPWPPPGSWLTDPPGAALPRVCISPDGASEGWGRRRTGPRLLLPLRSQPRFQMHGAVQASRQAGSQAPAGETVDIKHTGGTHAAPQGHTLLPQPRCPRLSLDSPLSLRLQTPRIPTWGLRSTRPVPETRHPAPHSCVYTEFRRPPSVPGGEGGPHAGWVPGPLPHALPQSFCLPQQTPSPHGAGTVRPHLSARSRA